MSHPLPEVARHHGRLEHFIDGQFVAGEAARVLPVVNPATAEEIAEVPLATAAEVDRALSAAAGVFDEWRETPPNLRVQPLYRLKVLLEEHYEEIARVLVQEHGKVIDEARGSVRRTIDNLEFACGIPSLLMGHTLEDGAAGGIDEEVLRQPLGVCAMAAPFNFPAMVPFWFWPVAVACGNTFVVKPSEQVPITQSRIFSLIAEAGFPPGVVNMIHGDRETVEQLLADPRVRAFSFVGSTPVARALYAGAARNGKRVQCQGGAKNFLAVMPDADLAACVPNMVSSFFGNAGQRCLAGAVLVPVGREAGAVVGELVQAARQIRLGYGLDERAQMGPVTGRRQYERVRGHIERGCAEGAEILLDGRDPQVPGYPRGCFIGPTVFDRVTPEMALAREEVFGPVVAVVRAATLEDAIALANTSRFGNAASIYTASGRAAREFKYRVQAGNVGINLGIAAPMAYFPFGGQKDSFFGDLHGQGRDGVDFFTDRKVVISRWI